MNLEPFALYYEDQVSGYAGEVYQSHGAEQEDIKPECFNTVSKFGFDIVRK